ncbi:MAG TPA: hypothetical protein VFK43_01530 [Acidimicrobiales bacterium]|nr:hypothetical protein [Acidimicrobiales bacterium]
MGIERSRVLEVHTSGPVGAGYLIDDRLLLTAGTGRAPAEVRPAGTATWLAAAPVWSSPAGAVILELEDPEMLMMPPARPRWGRITGRRPVAVAAMGFPPAPAPTRWARDPEHFFGHVVPAESTAMTVTGARAAGAGMTGAALFAGAELVGVLLAGARALSVGALAGEPGFAGLVGDERGGLALAEVSTPATAFPIF